MVQWLVKNVTLKGFALGAATSVVGQLIARPMLVSLVKTGLIIKEGASSALSQAKNEADKVTAQAYAEHAAGSSSHDDLMQEIAKLRADIADLKAKSGTN